MAHNNGHRMRACCLVCGHRLARQRSSECQVGSTRRVDTCGHITRRRRRLSKLAASNEIEQVSEDGSENVWLSMPQHNG
jgi:hypothetical protein